MVHGLLKWYEESVGDAWFAQDKGWKMGLWWCVKEQMGGVNYEVH